MKKNTLYSLLLSAAICADQANDDSAAWRSKVFRHIYDSNHWKSDESFSGPGSTVAVTHELRSLLPAIIKALRIESIIDAGCGDFNWMKEVDLGVKLYIGADIVESLIDSNNRKYAHDSRRFACLDITSDYIPHVDAIMCRDCLAHMSYADIMLALKNFKKSGATYLIISNFPALSANKLDIRTGNFRPVNFLVAPFNFPQPLMSFVELSAEPAMKKAGKCLTVWRLDAITISE